MTESKARADEVQRFILRELLRDEDVELRADETLFSSGLLDSFAVTPLMLFLEDRFGIRIPVSAVTLADFDTVDKIVDLVDRRAAAAGG
jgi:D-alanine--poly(phosphoribitol) ligase subunit 2